MLSMANKFQGNAKGSKDMAKCTQQLPLVLKDLCSIIHGHAIERLDGQHEQVMSIAE